MVVSDRDAGRFLCLWLLVTGHRLIFLFMVVSDRDAGRFLCLWLLLLLFL